MKQNLLGSPDYNIWDDETPAARALRENLPWHLSADEKARQPVSPPLPLPEAPAAPSLPGTDSTINDISNMVEDAAQNSFYHRQEKKRIDDFFNNRATPSVTRAPSGTPDPAGWQKNVQQQVAKTDDLLKQTRTAHPAANTPASTYPYNDMGKLVKPLSDRAIDNLVEPAAKTIKTAVTNQVPVSAAENDLVNLAGAFKNSVIEAAKSKKPFIATPEADLVNTTGAIRDGITDYLGNTYTTGNHEKAVDAVNNGEAHGHPEDFENPDPDTLNGMEKTWRALKLSAAENKYLLDKVIDPEGQYLDHKAEKAWMDQERKDIAAIKTTDIPALGGIDWKNRPDLGIKTAGKWLRESFAGEHLPGLAIELAKNPAGPVGNIAMGIMGGIASFNARSDELMQALIQGGGAGGAVESWNLLIGEVASTLPAYQRAGLIMMNNHFSNELKERIFKGMLKKYKDGNEIREEEDKNTSDPVQTKSGKGDDYSNATSDSDEDRPAYRIDVCGTSTYTCEKDRK